MKYLFAFILSALLFSIPKDFNSLSDEINTAFSARNTKILEQHFYFRTFVSVKENWVGYYAPSQVVKLIGSYLNSLKNYSFAISLKSSTGETGYLEGEIYYTLGTKHKRKKIFLTMEKIDGRWKITQITIN